jgi:dipeptidyl aminopeptidase/acylaminoacyl peptidase
VQIDGFLHLPPGQGPFPLVMMIHGGPTMRWTPRSLLESPLQAALADRGFAQFMPNPRGSTGRGQAFAASILHDVGGRDALDLLEGVDSLIERGLADPGALYVTGVSYGGFMTSWLVTMDSRFKAAAAVSPITDWASQRLTSDLPTFNDLYIGRPEAGDPSPIRFADRVQTEMLMIAGAKDQCTPPAQAEEFHRAVRLAGGASTLVVYPQEGHGISANPAAMIDHIARVIGVFEKHPPRHRRSPGQR